MKYRLEKLNQVQYADDEVRKAELEAKGFQIVGKAEASGSGAGALVAGNSVENPKASKKTKAVKGEDEDAG